MTQPLPVSTACWVCGSAARPFWANSAFQSVACSACGHIQAVHRPDREAIATDYHLGYDQEEFVASLAATRRRQAGRLLDALASLDAPPRSLFDFGCGRGWLLDAARERGLDQLAGGDVSDLALELLEQRGVHGVKLDADLPFEKLELEGLPFIPEAITFLDVLEHFPGDLGARLRPWLRALPPAVRFIVIKVPVRDGLLFSIANAARYAGLGSLGKQLFQAGTHPPHQQYFSRRSLAELVRQLGLTPLLVFDDLDFEPQELARRLPARGRLIRQGASLAGALLASAIGVTQRADSRIVIARRPAVPRAI